MKFTLYGFHPILENYILIQSKILSISCNYQTKINFIFIYRYLKMCQKLKQLNYLIIFNVFTTMIIFVFIIMIIFNV